MGMSAPRPCSLFPVPYYLSGMQRVASAWVWLVTAVVVIVWLPLMGVLFVLTVPLDPGRYAVGRWFRWAAITVVSLNPLWRFRTSGVRIRDPRRPYVAVANHESMADIFLISRLPWEMKWLAKESLFRLPVMGWMMRMAGDIAVRRSERASRVDAIEQCRDRLRKRVSVMIFPEGTRSRTGELLPFKDGAFRLAIEAEAPILPLAVVGTRDALAAGSLLIGRAHAQVRALEPIPTRGLTLNDLPALKEEVRTRIQAAREEMRREMGGGRAAPSTGAPSTEQLGARR
jgi:1-acyl-sn-glycerol-3-phosphate acyltransferase